MDFTPNSPVGYIPISLLTFCTTAIVTGFEIRLNTNPPAVEFGASLEMNCTTTCSNPIINVEYKPGIHPNRTTGSNWITDYFPSVQAWDFTAPCNVICKSQNNSADEQKKVVTVYNREINITSPPEVLEVNRTYSLECIGPRVYPNNKLILTWLRGSETLQINSTGEQGFPDEDIRLKNVFSFTASVSDDGQEYTCLAEVDLGSNSTKPIANCSVTLRAHFQQHSWCHADATSRAGGLVFLVDRLSPGGDAAAIVTGFEIRLNTNPPAVEFGASLEMNCTTTCSNPIINVEYKPGIHPNRTTGSNWITDYFPSVQAWDFTAPCNVICKSQNNRTDEQKVVVTVYNQEINITSPPEVLEVNRTYSLECIGPRVYPNNKLILTWLRGNQTLQINSTGEQGFPDEDIRLRNVFSFTASVSDDGQEYTCLAEVDLGSNSTKPIANCSVTLRAHSIVTGFEIRLNTNPPAVEFGASLEMNCTTTCSNPIINVEYKPGIHPNRTTGSNWITDYFPSVQAWDFTAPCNVICKSQNNRAAEQKVVVTVYNREINITSPPEVLEVNRTYSLECIGPRVYPNNKLILTWLRGSETLQINSTGEQGFPGEDIRLRNVFSFTASVSDDGQEYTCLAEVDLGSNSTKPIANCSVTLRAHYKPGDTTISVNNKTVSGFPVTVRKGDEVTMICNSNGNPTPTLKWEDPSNSSNVEIGSPGVLRISHATSGHQGVYKCRATNRYGIEEKEVDIRVTGHSWIRLVIGILAMIIIAALAGGCICIRTAHKRGLYKLYKAKPNNNSQIPNENEHQGNIPLKNLCYSLVG
ncbi:intercellular adhesion molecule 1-like isoform X3 [Scyliorhinus torazame]|uniref:intercellular adhesion molecule 1-like isoform X3 n=1 Tax=Scyliorhinus torazame TaxID=75743 RepID=UPI003B5BEE7D